MGDTVIDTTELHRDVGKHDAQIESLQQQVAQLHADMRSIISQLQNINDTLSQAKGGWRTLMAVAGAASAATAILGKLFMWFTR